jgi:hypothetical protein
MELFDLFLTSSGNLHGNVCRFIVSDNRSVPYATYENIISHINHRNITLIRKREDIIALRANTLKISCPNRLKIASSLLAIQLFKIETERWKILRKGTSGLTKAEFEIKSFSYPENHSSKVLIFTWIKFLRDLWYYENYVGLNV